MAGTDLKRSKRRSAARRLLAGRLNSGVLGRLLANQQLARRDQFEAVELPADRIVLLGDSITEFGNWDEWFPTLPLLNRGIGGETSAQVLNRLDSALNDPAGVSLLIGTNDLTQAVPIGDIVANVRRIVRRVRETRSDVPVLINSVMPRSPVYRAEIVELNRLLERVALDAPGIDFLDLWPALADDEGGLQARFTRDRLHLNGEGYRAWTELLRPFFDDFGTRRDADSSEA